MTTKTTITSTTNQLTSQYSSTNHLCSSSVASDGSFIVGKKEDLTIIHQSNHSQSASSSSYRKLVTFTPRLSTFDRDNQLLHQNPLRGLYALFWILLTFHILATLHASGSLTIQAPLARLFTKHLPQLALLDLCLVGSTFTALAFSKLISNRLIRYSPTGLILQHIFQFIWLASWIWFIFHRQWPWIQSGFLTLHSITMLMKIHSYCATNGEYSEKLKLLESSLDDLNRAQIIRFDRSTDLPKRDSNRLVSTLVSSKIYDSLHHLIDSDQIDRDPIAKVRKRVEEDLHSLAGDPTHHSSTSTLKQKIHETIEVLDQLGAKNLNDKADPYPSKCWPENLTVLNFIDYLLVPTLVYELSYPRTKEIRYLFVIEKMIATGGIFGLLYMITQYYIWDQVTNIQASVAQQANSHPILPLVDNVIKLVVPFTINYLLIFYIIFECICNGFAELSRFADREFYSDWWNSCSFDEFSRKWNKPVHNFLLKHVYASTISSYGVSRSAAAIITLFLSSLVHELLMVIVTRKLRLYLFLAQMTQLPLTYIGRSQFFKSRPGLANVFFWIGLLSGFPMLAVCYILY